VFVRTAAGVEEKIKIVGALMSVLAPRLRAHVTFSTDEFGRSPYRRMVTFARRHRADVEVIWRDHLAAETPPTGQTR
jgi:hypothetical protein